MQETIDRITRAYWPDDSNAPAWREQGETLINSLTFGEVRALQRWIADRAPQGGQGPTVALIKEYLGKVVREWRLTL